MRAFWETGIGKAAEQPLLAWFNEAKKAKWTGPVDIKLHYRSASFIGSDRVVFNIGGNKFRLVVAVRYASKPRAPKSREGVVYIRFVGTHAQYDRIDVARI